MKTKRLLYIVLIILIIPIGLSTRSHSTIYPDVVKEYGGDVLYATFVFFLVRFLAPKTSFLKVASISYLFCISIETLQLYHQPWIEKIRHTFPFGLILGYGFLWSDWICYGVGVLLALAICFPTEKLFSKKHE
jgi:hypothetical protein